MTGKKSRRPLYLASKNRHKLEELKAIIGEEMWELKLATDLDPGIGWDETGTTFEANARIKAMALRAHTNAAVLADDSGLEVDVLQGAPGVYSSRYAEEEGNDRANNQKLLAALSGKPESERSARFVCCLFFIDETGKEHVVRGECEGRIALQANGQGGFGYDPLFLVGSGAKTMADMSAAEKNAISHRSQAVKAWRKQFGS